MSTAKSWDSSYEWKAVLTLSLAFGLVGLDRFILPPLFPAMMKDLALNYQDLGNLVGALGIAWGVSAVVIGGLSDRLGRRKVLVPAVVLFSLLSVFSGMATGLMSLLFMRAIMGAAEGAVAPTGVAVAIEASHPTRRGMNNGIFQCTISLFGGAIGPILATQLLQFTTWRKVFWLVGIPGLVVAVALWFVIREPAASTAHAAGHAPTRAPMSRLFRHRNVPLSMVTLLCAMTGVFVLSAVMPNYLVDYLKLTGPQMGVVTSAIGFGGALGQFGLLTVSDFIGRRTTTMLSFIVAAVFLWLFIHTGGANLPMLFGLLFVAAMFNFGALAILAGPIPAEAAPVGLIASAAGLVIGAGEIFGGGIAPSIAGAIAQHSGIQYTLYFALCGQIVGLVLSLFLRETAPRRASRGGSVSELDSVPEGG
ncbi:MAG: transporter permease [Gammaproteobacteria bacterium]|nr:transporter permease [Gammaproteobacteria bacterium]